MKLPDLAKKQTLGSNDYFVEQDPDAKKKKFIIGGIIAVVIIALVLILTGGQTPAGQAEMRASLQATSAALAVINKYNDKLQYSITRNDVSLTRSLLQGNFQELNTLYNKTYSPKKKFSASSPKLDKTSQSTLDAADRNNSLDTAILTVLKPKITTAEKNLKLAAPSFTKKDSVDKIKSAIADLDSIQDTLNRAR